jgi:UDP-N-acetylmuramoyl-L-alanyl-D-glutamate--2,6-diaminopimelate ligase
MVEGSPVETARLLKAVRPRAVRGAVPPVVTGIRFDSRRVNPGDLFVAVPGFKADGARFIPEALARGAVGVVVRTGVPVQAPFVVEVDDPRAALADLAAAFYGQPSRALRVVGVTGTDGKTTTCHLIGRLLRAAGYRAAVLTTVYTSIDADEQPSPFNHTTPEAPDLQAWLAAAVRAGAAYAVIEVSSHALALHRVRGIEFDAAVLTNLTPEHLEFHGTFEAYRAAKARLFEALGSGLKAGPKFGVVNADDPSADHFRRACPAGIVDYAQDRSDVSVSARVLELRADRSRFEVRLADGRRYEITSRLPGRFNVYNWLAAIGALYGLGLDLDFLPEAAPAVGPVPGRLTEIDAGQPFRVVVDFAHTPAALETVLETLRAQRPRRVAVVLGHAGGRDPQNRPRLAGVAGRLADFVVITMDDPYDEDPAGIAAVMAAALEAAGRQPGRDFEVILDRRAAIARALAWAQPGDLVLIAGRGHEQFIPVAGRRIPFDDAAVVRELLTAGQDRG